MYCSNCGLQYPEGVGFCQSCGSQLAPTQQNAAPQYGPPVQPPQYNQHVQPPYGQQPGQPQYNPNAKSRVAAGVLGILLGGLGVHNFYLGNNGKAIAQLLLSIVGWLIVVGPIIAGIWGLVEGIMILTKSINTDSNGVPLTD